MALVSALTAIFLHQLYSISFNFIDSTDVDPRKLLRLLSVRGERPCERAAEKDYELTSLHSFPFPI